MQRPAPTISPSLAAADVAAAFPWPRRRGVMPQLLLAAVLLIAVCAVSLTLGAADIPPLTALRLALAWLPLIDAPTETPEVWQRIVVDVRLPRIAAAAMVGASLAYSGAAYQGVFRNPLADPFLLGVAAGAALGAAIAIVSPLHSSVYGFGWVPLFAFAGAACAVILATLFSQLGPGISSVTLILAGVAISAVASAATSFLMLTGGDRSQAIFSFLFGSFNTATWERLTLATPYLLVGAVIVALFMRVLNVLQLDEAQATDLGVHVLRTRLLVLAGASLMAATAVAMAGVIGFVGLVVPHITRMLFGGDHRRLLPLSALLGGAFLVSADALSRTIIAPQEVPVGIVTAVVGGPFFLFLIATRRVGGWS